MLVIEEDFQHPLILKVIHLERDVAWERSLALKTNFIKSKCIVTVDGFLLFFDLDRINEEDKTPGFILLLENVK